MSRFARIGRPLEHAIRLSNYFGVVVKEFAANLQACSGWGRRDTPFRIVIHGAILIRP